MTSINPVGQLVSVIRRQLDKASPTRGRQRAAPRAPAQGAVDDLTDLIELRVAQIERGDPQRGRKAFRIFLEAVLLAHFGVRAANDARFGLLLDDIQQAMENDPASKKLVALAVEHLLARQTKD